MVFHSEDITARLASLEGAIGAVRALARLPYRGDTLGIAEKMWRAVTELEHARDRLESWAEPRIYLEESE